MSRTLFRALIMGFCILFATSAVHAIGSGEKSPDKLAAETFRKATKEYNEGVKHMEKAKAIVAKGDSAYAFNYRATSDAKAQKEYEKAIARFKTSISLEKRLKEAWSNLGYCHRKLGALEESIRCYNEALSLDSNFAEAREYRAETYLALGYFEEATNELYFLRNIKSPYADTLAASIEFYTLDQLKQKLPGQK